ncbi:hypothetical protein B0H19DRAFT_1187134 [Mycena capillaripes]|nr:hypothetical protein B0H19DRAFT_1186864 [Mycena capillaripes]KAJ6533162.1 hypothetical protein B0H19DRAFT_1187134 [Mycena capillaripes]
MEGTTLGRRHYLRVSMPLFSCMTRLAYLRPDIDILRAGVTGFRAVSLRYNAREEI